MAAYCRFTKTPKDRPLNNINNGGQTSVVPDFTAFSRNNKHFLPAVMLTWKVITLNALRILTAPIFLHAEKIVFSLMLSPTNSVLDCFFFSLDEHRGRSFYLIVLLGYYAFYV